MELVNVSSVYNDSQVSQPPWNDFFTRSDVYLYISTADLTFL